MVEFVFDENLKDLNKISWLLRFRHAVYNIRKWTYMDDKKRKTDFFKVTHEFMFQYNRGISPGFYRWVKKELKKVSWVQLHIEELGYLILLDMLHPEVATMKDAKETMKGYRTMKNGIAKERVTSRHRRRVIREYYPEIFFTPPKELMPRFKDKRKVPFKSVFTELPPLKEGELEEAIGLIFAQDLAMFEKLGDIDLIMEIHSGLRMVEPEDIISLRWFWKSVKASIEAIEMEFGRPTEEKKLWLIKNLTNRTMGLETLYRLVDDAVALRWFRKKQEIKREQIIQTFYPLRYTKQDAANAVAENLDWFEDPIQVFDLISRGADAYAIIGMPEISIHLYSECFKQIPMDMRDMGLCHHNLSFCYRQMNKPKKAISELKKGMDIWKELDSKFDIGITWAYFGEYYHILGKEELVESSFTKSFDILSNSGLTPEKQAKAYLYVADCAGRIRIEKWEREALELCLESSSKSEDNDLFLYISQRLLDLNMGRSTFEAELEPGKLRHPPEFLWGRLTPTTFVPIHPSRKNKYEKKKQ